MAGSRHSIDLSDLSISTDTADLYSLPGKILLDEETVEDCQLIEKSIIKVVDLLKINVKVEAMDGRKIEFEIRKSDTISDFSRLIKKKIRYNESEHGLIYLDTKLEYDCETVGKYGIEADSVIRVVKRPQNTINVLARMCDGRVLEFTVVKTDFILHVKKEIQSRISLETYNQRIMFKGKIMSNYDTIEKYCENDEIVINVYDSKRDVRIFANIQDGAAIPIEATESETIHDIKRKIHEKTEILPCDQKVVFEGKILADEKCIRDCNISTNSLINITRDPIEITVSTMNGRPFSIHVQNYHKISEVKKNIEKKIELFAANQRLVYMDRILEDDRTIDSYGITRKSDIVVIHTFGNFEIIIRTTVGRIFTIEVNPSALIIDLKKKMYEMSGMAVREQIFEYRGEILENERTIDDYSIGNNSVINNVSSPRSCISMLFNKDNERTVFRVGGPDTIPYHKLNPSKTQEVEDDQVFIYQGEIVDDLQSIDVEYVKIYENNIIDVVQRKKNMRIFVKVDATPYLINVTNIDRIIDIKKKVQCRLKIPLDEQIFKFKGNILRDDNLRLYKCKIMHENTIDVLKKSDSLRSIRILIGPNNIVSLEVHSLDTILDVKRHIEAICAISARDQRLEHIIPGDDAVVSTLRESEIIGSKIEKPKARGICFIVNNKTFTGKHKPRRGTGKDVKNIEKTFTDLGYDIKLRKDVKHCEMINLIDETKKEIEKSHKMFIAFILSHGDNGVVVFTDDKTMPFEEIWKPFTNERFKKFNGKPKLFFFVCCQGDKLIHGIDVSNDSHEEGDNEMEPDGDCVTRSKYPATSDLFFGYASCQDHVAGRFKDRGTVYVESLCEVLRNNIEWSISDIHQEVQSIVSATPIYKDQFYQMPYYTNLLTSHAYFLDK